MCLSFLRLEKNCVRNMQEANFFYKEENVKVLFNTFVDL